MIERDAAVAGIMKIERLPKGLRLLSRRPLWGCGGMNLSAMVYQR